ncbi:MAG: class I SAM-dependent methyltransferase [Pseudomonadota bacterium]
MENTNVSNGVADTVAAETNTNGTAPSGADQSTAKGIEWDTYGPLLDIQAGLTPDYWENVDVLVEHAKATYPNHAEAQLRICDVGAGTGNFTRAIAEAFPKSEVVHIEPNRHMNYIAQQKFADDGLDNVKIVQSDFFAYDWQAQQWDIVICVNALYMLSPQSEALRIIRDSLRPQGFFYVVDFGREQDAKQWFWYFLKNAVKGVNTKKYLQSIPKWPDMIAQAREGGKTQVEGAWWMHETDEFGATLEAAGFQLQGLTACYCGFADRAICRPIE